MAHALREFIRQQMDDRGIDQATFGRASGLSRSHVSKLLKDDRDRLPQLPRRETLAAIGRAFSVSEQVVLAVAIEALGLGYEADAFHYEIASATPAELLDALRARVEELQEAQRPRSRDGSEAPSLSLVSRTGAVSEGQRRRAALDAAGEDSQDPEGDA